MNGVSWSFGLITNLKFHTAEERDLKLNDISSLYMVSNINVLIKSCAAYRLTGMTG